MEDRRWSNRRVLVTGGSGFLGRRVVALLQTRGYQHVFVPRSREYDLRQLADVIRLYRDTQPDLVLHLAAVVGGIGANQRRPAELFYDNIMMGVQLLDQARRVGVEKFVTVGTVCAYPRETPVPFTEDQLWNGYPEETNAPYGIAKRVLLVQGQAYRQQYGMNAIYLLPTNLYGPFDNFNLESSHVIPALIRKCLEAVEAGAQTIEVWGDGTPTREFLYVDDAAEGIILAAEQYNGNLPVNLGSGHEISIRHLAELIARLTQFTGHIVFNTAKLNGQPRRSLDSRRAYEQFGFRPRVPFEEGLATTIAWYRECRRHGATTGMEDVQRL